MQLYRKRSFEVDTTGMTMKTDSIDQTTIFNSLMVPLVLPEPVIIPLIKKLDVNPVLLILHKNYLPVSNFPALAKIIAEHDPAWENLSSTSKEMTLQEHFQLAYKSSHCTETDLLRVKGDVLSELDKGRVIMLVLFDLSSAFNTIDHDILDEQMKREFGISGSALKLSYRL